MMRKNVFQPETKGSWGPGINPEVNGLEIYSLQGQENKFGKKQQQTLKGTVRPWKVQGLKGRSQLVEVLLVQSAMPRGSLMLQMWAKDGCTSVPSRVHFPSPSWDVPHDDQIVDGKSSRCQMRHWNFNCHRFRKSKKKQTRNWLDFIAALPEKPDVPSGLSYLSTRESPVIADNCSLVACPAACSRRFKRSSSLEYSTCRFGVDVSGESPYSPPQIVQV